MNAAIALSERGVGTTGLNPPVGCIVANGGRVVGRGFTQAGGRPHAEAIALQQAGDAAKGSTFYISLEPCAHHSERGPACAQLIADAKPRRVVCATQDPDARTAGKGFALLRSVGIDVELFAHSEPGHNALAGFFSRIEKCRPYVTLKLATSLDGQIAMADGSSRWITGDAARAHAHLERARADAILVGSGTFRRDAPSLNVRLPGLQNRSPRRVILGSADGAAGWENIAAPSQISTLDCNNLLVEGGAQTASSFLRARLVDRLLLYRAPIMIGYGKACLGDIGLAALGAAHGQWQLTDTRMLGNDRLEVYHPGNRK